LYKNTQRCLGGFKKDGECLLKGRPELKEIKPEVIFHEIDLLILPLLIRLDYYIIVILKQALLKMEDNKMKNRIRSL